jgi:DNA-binding MarR family transcriptional regulator
VGDRDVRLANLLGAVATGLTDNDYEVVSAVAELDGRAAAALVALLDFTPSGTVRVLSQVVGLTHAGGVRLVNRLVQAGYVERKPGGDARSISVDLTSRGRSTARQIRKHRHTALTAALAGLTEAQREQLTTLCEVLITNLTNQRLTQRAGGTRPAGGALCRMCDFDACGRPAGRCPAATAAAESKSRHHLGTP